MGTWLRLKISRRSCLTREPDSESFEAGDKVLVSLPTANNTLQAEWKGPLGVVKEAWPVDYVVNMGTRTHREQKFHVSMLQKWEECENMSFPACYNQTDGEVEVSLHPQPCSSHRGLERRHIDE